MDENRGRYDEKLALILRTAAAVFAEKGYHQASIRDISRATGVSLSGLYYYVSSKEELMFRIQDHCFGTVLENLERKLAGVAPAEERLRLVVDNHLRFFVHNMQEMKVLSHEAESLTGEFREQVNRKKRRYTELVSGIVGELAPAGVDARVATFSLFGMMNWVYNWYRPERDVAVGRLVEEMAELFLVGLVARSGGRTAAPEGTETGPSIWRR
jgi:TetR/AcrR family transcriptional regulator, cholesterol catabolism regulator